MDLRAGVLACACLGACVDRAPGDDRAPPTHVSMRWPSTGDVVASPRPRVRWSAPPGARVRVNFCADRRCDRVIEAVETDGSAVQPTRPLPVGVVFWRAYEAAGGLEPSGPTWWFVVPRAARDTPARASWDLGWTGMRDVDGDGRWDPLDHRGVLAVRQGGRRVVRTWLTEQGSGPVTEVGDLDGDGYVDFAGADPQRDGGAGRVLVWKGPLGAGAVAPWRSGGVAEDPLGRSTPHCGAEPSRSGDFDGDGRRELVVSCPDALSGRGEVYVIALEGEGLGRALRVIRASASGAVRGDGSRLMRALLTDDLDGDGYDDLVVGMPSARCEWVSSAGYCANDGWIAVYLGGPTGIGTRAPWTYILSVTMGGGGLGLAATLADLEGDDRRELVLASGSLQVMTFGAGEPALTRRELDTSGPWLPETMFALASAEGADRLVTGNVTQRFELTRASDGSLSRRPLGVLATPWRAEHSELADVQGDGVPDLVVHAVGPDQRAAIFAWQGDANGRLDAPTQLTQ